jgi:hypothetical protein
VQPLGVKWLGVLPAKKTDDEQTTLQSKLLKFQEAAWKGISYSLLALSSGYALSFETFWMNTEDFWGGCGGALPCTYQASRSMQFAYALQLGYYCYHVPALLFFDKRKKDHWAMVTHHVATILLVGYSYMIGWTKIGVVIMFLHDLADPFMEAAKLARYTGKRTMTDVMFVCFMLLWTVMRMVYFPFWVNRSMLFECYGAVVGAGNRPSAPHYEFMTALLLLLQCLHTYWTYLIYRIAYRAVFEGKMDDSREDDDDE